MDGRRFDQLTKVLAAAGSRRRMLGSLTGGATAFLATLLGRRGVSAQACPEGQVNRRGIGCVCRSTGRPPVNDTCCGVGTSGCFGSCCERDEVCVEIFQGSFGCSPELEIVAAPMETVWTALTDPKAVASWAFAADDLVPEVGRRFQLTLAPRGAFDGVIDGEVLAVDPMRSITFAWEGGPITERATFTLTLEPTADGTRTRLRFSSEDRPAACRAAVTLLGRHWRKSLFNEALPRYLKDHDA